MRNFTLLILALVSLTALAAWFFLRPDPPRATDLTVEPMTSTCPGGSVRFRAVVSDTESWTLRERSSSGTARDLVIGEVTEALAAVAAPVAVCPASRLCLEVEGRGGTSEACIPVLPREGEWLDRIVFEPACPDRTYSPVRIGELDPGGHRTILAARNTSPDTITLIHETDGAPLVSERAGPGAPYSEFSGRSFHGTWTLDREATLAPGLREECRPADAPLDATPPPGVVWLAPIEIQVSLTCASSATGCP